MAQMTVEVPDSLSDAAKAELAEELAEVVRRAAEISAAPRQSFADYLIDEGPRFDDEIHLNFKIDQPVGVQVINPWDL